MTANISRFRGCLNRRIGRHSKEKKNGRKKKTIILFLDKSKVGLPTFLRIGGHDEHKSLLTTAMARQPLYVS